MSVKFRLNFVIDAETLFGILSRFLPVEDLNIEEVAPPRAEAAPEALPPRVQKTKKVPRKRRYKPTDMDHGANSIILSALADGQPHRPSELKALFARAGFSSKGVGSRLARLHSRGVLTQPEMGLWRLAPAYLARVGSPVVALPDP